MRLLTFTNLYPSEDRPRHGIFVAERLRHLVAGGGLSAQVVALRPAAAGFVGPGAESGARDSRSATGVHYTRVPHLPLLTNWLDPWLWARATESMVKRLVGGNGAETVIDAHYLYPDGVAAVILGKRLGLKTVMTARGSDVNVKCEDPVMRRWVKWAAANCAAVITVSRALAAKLAAYGIEAPIVEVLPNGVDLAKFRPLDRAACRERWGAVGRTLVSVGHLVAAKGHDLAIEALVHASDAKLLIVGEGPERAALESLARQRGVAARVAFLGLVRHETLPEVYNAADVLLLPSAREGMPNVVLESIACGTRVVATDVGGIAEVLTSPVAGELMRSRSVDALRESLDRVASRAVSVAETRTFAERFAWDAVIAKQVKLYRRVLHG